MNAIGMTAVISGVYTAVTMPFFQKLVTDGSIQQGELDGTRKNLGDIIAILKKTPPEKIEAMVAEYNDELTTQLNSFNSHWAEDLLPAFREAQVMTGYVTSIMDKSGLTG